jgi:hypothetical protein
VIASTKKYYAAATPWICLALAVVVFGWNLYSVFNFTMDDSFIYLRYAENLAYHGVLDFNFDGEMNEGFTTFLYTILLAVVRWFGGDPIIELKAIGFLSLVGVLSFSIAAIRALTPDTVARKLEAIWFCVAFLVFPSTAFHVVSGMETMFFTMCLSALAYTWALARKTWNHRSVAIFGFVCLLAGLCRPEGNLVAIVLAADLALKYRARTGFWTALALTYVLPGAAYFIWRYMIYGLLFPAPFYIKVGVHGFLGIGPVVRYYIDIAIVAMFLPFLALMVRQKLALLTLIAPLVVVVFLFSVFYLKPLHNMGYESRFLYPLTCLILIAGALAVQFRVRLALVLMVISVLAGTLLSVKRHGSAFQDWVEYGTDMVRGPITLGKDLARYKARYGDAWLATNDAGAIPYYSGLSTLDILGLNNKEIAVHGYTPEYAFSKELTFIIIVTLQKDHYEEMTPNEGAILKDALARGYQVLATYMASSKYYYLVLGKSENAKVFFEEIVKERPGLKPNPSFQFDKMR